MVLPRILRYDEWIVSKTSTALSFGPGLTLADIGGGTGHTAVALATLANKNTANERVFSDMTVVEPSDALRHIADSRGVKTSHLDAVSWANLEQAPVDRILMKEVIHHVPSHQTKEMWSSILISRLSPGGRICIITRPQTGIDYPFFKRAVDEWEASVEPHEKLLGDLNDAGFSEVTATLEAYPCEVELEQWLGMVRGRFWSTFHSFSDEELEEGCQEIVAAHEVRMASASVEEPKSSSILRFEDRLFFITASKPVS
jgi:protein-L-isoaspartate O-methyltransferase